MTSNDFFYLRLKLKNFFHKYSYVILLFISSLVFVFYLSKIFIKKRVVDIYKNDYKINSKTKESNEEVANKMTDIKKEVKSDNLGHMPTWDLSDLYSSLNDKNIEKDINLLKKSISEFVKTYQFNVETLSGDELYLAIKEYEDINELMGKLGAFSYLKYTENLSIDENVKFYQKISELLTEESAKLSFFTIEINNLDYELLKIYLNSSKKLRDNYSTFIENIRLFKKYQLSQEMEEFLTKQSITSSQAWSRLFDETMDNMTFDYDGKKLNEAQILEIINGPNKEERRKAGKIFGETLGKNIKIFAYITNVLAKNKSIIDEKRGFTDPIQSRNLSNLIEDEVVESLYNTVQENYAKISHKYYKLKAKIFGVDKLHYTDRNAPLPFSNDNIYSWDDTVMIVMNAYSNFSPKMAEIGQKFFDNNWIDVPTRQGKRGGAFMMPTTTQVHPYILLNYQGKSRDIMTLAHELGHGIHQTLANKQGYFNSDTPLTLAETASVFGEQLTFRYLLNQETDKNQKIAIIANKIEDMINTVIRQIAFLEFEKTVHAERKKGEISVDRLNEIWMNVQKKSLGDAFEYDEEYKYYWAYIPHFIHSPFYVYAYAFGDCLVNSLYYQYMKNPNGFADKYIELLSAGGSKKYDKLLEKFNLNPKNKEFWQNGLNMISDLINQLEELLN